MKTISKLLAVKPLPFIRNFSLSLACVALVALMLYVLINSPA